MNSRRYNARLLEQILEVVHKHLTHHMLGAEGVNRLHIE